MNEMMVLLLVIGVILVVIALNRISTLQQRIGTLECKVEGLLGRQRHDAQMSAPSRTAAPTPAVPTAPARSAPDASKPKAEPSMPPAARSAATPAAISAPRQTFKPAPKPATPPKPKLDLETLLGAKGSVWIGGIALLFGAVFLLRYTIEAGLLTPTMRIGVAVLMGVVALGLSEWMARRDLKSPAAKALAAKADIPAILAAVGVFTLFGAVYASHALYALIGTFPAFIALALIALGGMGLSLRRGPWLAAIGLIGALVVPWLVASVTPSFFGVVFYVALITGAALWVAKRQAWPWLRAAAFVGATFWLTMLLGKSVDGAQLSVWMLGLFGVNSLTVRDISRASGGPHLQRWLWLGWAGVAVLTALAVLAGDDYTPISYALPFAVLLGYFLEIRRGDADRLWPLLPIGGGLFMVIMPYIWPDNPDVVWLFIAALSALAAAFALVTLSTAQRLASDRGATALTLICGLIAAGFLVDGIGTLTPLGLNSDVWAGLSLAGLFAVATAQQTRLAVVRGAIWTSGAVWLLCAVLLSGTAVVASLLSVGLAGIIGLAWFARAGRDDLWVRLAALLPAAATGLAAVDVLQDAAQHIGTTPVLNALWLYFGLPGAIAGAGAFALRRRRDDMASQALLGGAIVFALLLLVLLIHHAMNGGNLRSAPGFDDYAVQLLVAFAALFGASWLRGGLTDWPGAGADPRRFIVPVLALLVSGLSLLLFVTAQLLALNPLFNAQTVIDGHPVFNSLALAYLAPAILLGGTALRVSGRRPVWFVRLLGALAGVSWLMWTTAQIRRLAQGEVIAIPTVPWGSAELYAVSAVWLVTGMALLGAGMKTGRRDWRLASAGLITLTTLKVFLVDMAALDGALRAVSFIGLGIVLIGIGRLYQTILMRPDSAAEVMETNIGETS